MEKYGNQVDNLFNKIKTFFLLNYINNLNKEEK